MRNVVDWSPQCNICPCICRLVCVYYCDNRTHLLILPQTNLGSGPSLPARAAWYPCTPHVSLQASTRMVVWCHFSGHVCLWRYSYWSMAVRFDDLFSINHLLICIIHLQYSDASMGFRSGISNCIRLHNSYRHDSSYYQSTSWSEVSIKHSFSKTSCLIVQRHYRTHHRICSTWSSNCYDVVQDMGLYHYGAGPFFYIRLQTRTLHESSASPHVLGSSISNCYCRYYTTWRPSLDVQ